MDEADFFLGVQNSPGIMLESLMFCSDGGHGVANGEKAEDMKPVFIPAPEISTF